MQRTAARRKRVQTLIIALAIVVVAGILRLTIVRRDVLTRSTELFDVAGSSLSDLVDYRWLDANHMLIVRRSGEHGLTGEILDTLHKECTPLVDTSGFGDGDAESWASIGPSLSADGKWLATINDDGVMCWRVGSHETRLFSDRGCHTVVWSAQGETFLLLHSKFDASGAGCLDTIESINLRNGSRSVAPLPGARIDTLIRLSVSSDFQDWFEARLTRNNHLLMIGGLSPDTSGAHSVVATDLDIGHAGSQPVRREIDFPRGYRIETFLVSGSGESTAWLMRPPEPTLLHKIEAAVVGRYHAASKPDLELWVSSGDGGHMRLIGYMPEDIELNSGMMCYSLQWRRPGSELSFQVHGKMYICETN